MPGNNFISRLYWPTQLRDAVYRVHFGPGYVGNPATNYVGLFARAQGTLTTSQCIFFGAYPGRALAGGSRISIIAEGQTAVHTDIGGMTGGTCPSEGWLELIVSGGTITGNIYATDGVTLLFSCVNTVAISGTYLNAGYGGVLALSINNFISEYGAWESISIAATPTFMPLNTTTVFNIVGEATSFSGTPFTISGVAGCSITSQIVTNSTIATVIIASGGTAGNLLLTDTISGATFTILVTATPQISLTPNTYTGSGTLTVIVNGINIALSGTPFSVTGTPSATITSTAILDAHNAVLDISVGSYSGWLTVTDTVSGAAATIQIYHANKGTLIIGFIGDSITAGTAGTATLPMIQFLSEIGYVASQVNKGVSGSTSVGWANNTGNILTSATTAFAAAHVQYVHIMLGTNDAQTVINTSVAAYLNNITIIKNACLAIGAKVILSQPIWTVPGLYSSIFALNVNTIHQQYYNAVLALVDNINVFAGDTLAADWFQLNPTDLADGLHPTGFGYVKLGNIWAYSFLAAIAQTVTPTPTAGSNAALTKAQMRDNIRHNLNKLTSMDEDPVTGIVGNPATTHPWPSNGLINSCLLKALAEVNRRAGFNEIQNVNLPVPIGTSTPQTFDIRTIGLTQGLAAGQINEIRSVWWIDSVASTPRRVYPVARDEMDRDSINYMAWSPSTPRRFSMDGYTLSLYPASSLGGTLMLIVGNGIVGFVTDTDTIETLPMDYHPVIEYVATRLVALTQSTDVEMDKSAQTFGALAVAGIMDVEKWVLRKNVEEQRSIGGQPQNGNYYGGYSYRR